jgi:hypothetical protein
LIISVNNFKEKSKNLLAFTNEFFEKVKSKKHKKRGITFLVRKKNKKKKRLKNPPNIFKKFGGEMMN